MNFCKMNIPNSKPLAALVFFLCSTLIFSQSHAQEVFFSHTTVPIGFINGTVGNSVKFSSNTCTADIYLIRVGGSENNAFAHWTKTNIAANTQLSGFDYFFTVSMPGEAFLYQIKVIYKVPASGTNCATTRSFFATSPAITVNTTPCRMILNAPQKSGDGKSVTLGFVADGPLMQNTIQYARVGATTYNSTPLSGGSQATLLNLDVGSYKWRGQISCNQSTSPFASYVSPFIQGANFKISPARTKDLFANVRGLSGNIVADLEWRLGPGYEPHYYILRYRLASATTWTRLNVTNTRYTTPPLQASKKYKWQVRAVYVNAVGKTVLSNWSRIANFRTIASAASLPEGMGDCIPDIGNAIVASYNDAPIVANEEADYVEYFYNGAINASSPISISNSNVVVAAPVVEMLPGFSASAYLNTTTGFEESDIEIISYNFTNCPIPPQFAKQTSAPVNEATNSVTTSFGIYPNRVQNYCVIVPGKGDDVIISTELFDISGKRVFRSAMVKTLDLSRLPAGLYMYKVKTNSNSYTGKIVKQ